MKILTIIFVLISSLSAFGQAKKTTPKPTAKAIPSPTATPTQKIPIIEIGAITNDGKAVILRSDGTWQFNENAPAAISAPAKTSLSIEAAVIYSVGGAQPVARTDFALLDKSLDDILTDAGLTPMQGVTLADSFGFALKGSGLTTAYTSFANRAVEAIKPHIKYQTVTDFTGKGKFDDIAPGNYWIFGATQTRKGFAIWSLPVVVKNGESQAALDQNNAAGAF